MIKMLWKKLLPLLVFALLSWVSISVWRDRINYDRRILDAHTRDVTNGIAHGFETFMEDRLAVLESLAKRWPESPDFTQQRFVGFAKIWYGAYPGFLAINWIDPEGVIRWVYPVEPNRAALNKNLHKHPELGVQEAFRRAERTHRYSITPCIELYQGGQGFATYWPLIYEGRLQGYLNGVFRVKPLISEFSRLSKITGFWLEVYEDDRRIYKFEPGGIAPTGEAHRVWQNVHFRGRTWRLGVRPETESVESVRAVKNLPLLALLLALSAVLSLLLHYFIRHADQYKALWRQAMSEAKERKSAEEKLRLRNEMLAAQNAVARAVATSLTPEALSDRLLEEVQRLFPCDAFFVKSYNPQEDEALGIRDYDTIGDKLQRTSLIHAPIHEETRLGKVIRERKPLLINRKEPMKEAAASGLVPFGDATRPSASLMFVPMVVGDQVVGVMSVQSYTLNAYNERHLELFYAMAQQAGAALQASLLARKLRESEERFSQVTQATGDWIWETDTQGRYVYSSPVVEKILGYTPREMLGKHFYDFLHPDEREELKARALETFSLKQPFISFVNRNIHKDGHTVILETTGVPLLDAEGNLIGYRGADRDITERVQAEEALRESEQRFRAIFETIPDSIFLKDQSLHYAQVNPGMEALFGVRKEELIGKSDRELFGEEEATHLAEIDRRVLAGEIVSEERTKPVRGIPYTFHTVRVPMRDTTGKIIGICGIARDITERKSAEEALREQAWRNEQILYTSIDGFFLLGVDGGLREANPAFCRMVGYSRDELLGMNIRDLEAKETPEETTRHIKAVRAKGGDRFETRYRCKNGHIVNLAISTTFYEGKGARFIIGFARDITEQIRLENQLRQAAKMEAVGRLAGGIAHDFNNVLTGILGFADRALEKVPPDSPIRSDLEVVISLAERASDLTSQLLAFGRKKILAPRIFNINTVIENVDKMLQQIIGEDIDLVTVPAPDLGQVKADPTQIEQVILNLAVNSREAMPRGGKLTIETANVDLDEEYARTHPGAKQGPYVMLAVSDTGCGISKEIMQHVFEPFFTTKEPGRGTGLGLATVYGIVKQSEGNVWVYSEPDKGATFKVYLPRIEEEEEKIVRAREPDELPGGTETILVVEDEETVRELAVHTLRDKGYTVLEAQNGQEALTCYEHYEGKIDLLLTDVVMPEMGGYDLASHLKPQRPDTKVLYISGYTENAIVHDGILAPGTAFLAKPFRPESLLRKVRQVLES